MDKWNAILLSIVATAIFGSLALQDKYENESDTAKANAGLEECPRNIGSSHTIWVKDCPAYIKMEINGK